MSAERTRHPHLIGKNVVVAKGSDKKIFSHIKKSGKILGDTGAFNSVLEFSNNYGTDLQRAWREEFIDEDGAIHGIVIAKSYETKPYGIKTGTPLKDALRMAPDLYVLPSDHLFYQELSQNLKRFLELKIPVLEQGSIDEFYGDLSGWISDEDTLEFISDLQQEIMERFNLPISIGASRSKWIAKLLTDRIKPYGVIVLKAEDVLAYTHNIDINEFAGIGPAISNKLKEHKIKTLGELRECPALLNDYGKMGRDLYKRICGVDDERVIPYNDRRGIGISRNFKAIQERSEIFRRVIILARYLSYTIMKLSLNPTTFYFKIGYEYGIKSSESITFDRLFNERFLIDLAKKMIHVLDLHPSHKIHYIALSASNFSNRANYKTYSLVSLHRDRKFAALSGRLNEVRDKYGVDMIRYARETLISPALT